MKLSIAARTFSLSKMLTINLAEEFAELRDNGQIFTQYVDFEGKPSMDSKYNPNGSVNAIEGITSKNGQIIGKMGHSERFEDGLFQNIPASHGEFVLAIRVSTILATCWLASL